MKHLVHGLRLGLIPISILFGPKPLHDYTNIYFRLRFVAIIIVIIIYIIIVGTSYCIKSYTRASGRVLFIFALCVIMIILYCYIIMKRPS